MTHALRHIAFRIWFTILFGGIGCLWILPLTGASVPLKWMFLPALSIFILVFLGLGWIYNQVGLQAIRRSVSEAVALERTGNSADAERSFQKAVSIFDSFLLSPVMKRKKSSNLTSRLARFYLARADKSHEAEIFIYGYLLMHPEDEEVAETWLRQVENYGWLEKRHYELAYRIGNAQLENWHLQNLLARLYLMDERTDFQALQIYRRVISENNPEAVHIITRLADMFIREKRADEWAMEIYIDAYQNNKSPHLLRGIAACIHWAKVNERTKPLRETAHQLLAGVSADELEEMHMGFNPPVLERGKIRQSILLGIGMSLGRGLLRAGKGLFRAIRQTVSVSFEQLERGVELFRQSQRIRSLSKWCGAALLILGVVLLILNTVSHLQKSGKKPAEKIKVTHPVTGRFTLQVAAYLKLEHAKRYAAVLKKQDVEVYWTEARGKQKKWYQVRISRFPDKASARVHGEALKAKGIVDDYYIANYTPP